MRTAPLIPVLMPFFVAVANAGVDSPPDPLWQRPVEAALADLEYHAAETASGLSFCNRAQNLRIAFGADGLDVSPRLAGATSFSWRLRFAAFGRGASLAPVAAVPYRSIENRVVATRDGVAEWYTNDARGLEQGFTFDARPAGGGPLVVELESSGTLAPRAAADDPDAIELTNGGGAISLRLDHLAAFDADGRPLRATMRAFAATIRIEVDDAGAHYPLTIDPLASFPAWGAESDQSGAQFGISVGTAGDVNGDGFSDAIVGAWLFDNGQNDEGAAFVYLGSPTGLANAPAWTADGGLASALFGWSVGTAGDVNGDGFADVIVGAEFGDNGEIDEGRAFVYLGSATGLATSPAWTGESNQANAAFGSCVATAGDVNGDGFSDVIVGAVLFDVTQTDEGAAFVYHGSASGLGATAAWSAAGGQASSRFGKSVATAGDVDGDGFSDGIVGAELFDNGQTNEGRAFLYRGSATGLATSPAWTNEINQASAEFGHSVATAGDVNGDGFADVVVGAPDFDNGQSNEGRAYLYLGNATGLDATLSWLAESNQVSALFGDCVATAGDLNGDGFADVVVSADFFDGGQTDEGRVSVYFGSANDLTGAANWTAESDQASASLGFSVATAGDVNGDGFSDLIAGAYRFDDGQTDEGAVFAWYGASGPLSFNPGWKTNGNQTDEQLGTSVASAGDVDGDGLADVMIGDPGYRNGSIIGRVQVCRGTVNGPGQAWFINGSPGLGLGYTVASAGDVNGDGFADVMLAAPAYTNSQQAEGEILVYHGSPSGPAPTPAWTTESNQAFAGLDRCATAGDVNGDGYADVIIGARTFDDGQHDEGRASIFLGSAAGLGTSPVWEAEGNQDTTVPVSFPVFGSSVSTAGDVNADGFSDVIVGAPGIDDGQADEGRAFVYLGSSTGVATTPAWTAESDQANGWFGGSVATAGDVNGDGFADVLVGARQITAPEIGEGRAYVFLGNASGVAATPAWTTEGNQYGAELGSAVAAAGDVNGDGFSDVLVGAVNYSNDQPNEGRALLFLGSSAGLGANAAWTGEATTTNGLFAYSLACAGDVNGDGFSDAIIGFPFEGVGSNNHEGAAWFYFGNQGPGLLTKPQQRKADESAPIAPRGRTVTASFIAHERLRSAFGRGDARLAVESKPFGVPFDGTGLTQSALADTGIAGVDGAVTIGGLVANTGYHWRARVVHTIATTPFLPAGPWFSTGDNGENEMDLRTDCCGGTLAAATAYGAGKPGTSGVPILTSTVPPALGALCNVTITNAKPSAGPVLLFVGLTSTSIPFDGGALFVNPTWTQTLPAVDPTGALALPIQISPSVVQCGMHAFFQAFVIDPGAVGFYHTAQTNGLDWTLGS